MSISTVGFDLGTNKAVIVSDDAGLVLTTTGGISRPTLVTFFGRARLFGEEAAAQNTENTVPLTFDVIGRPLLECATLPLSSHRKSKLCKSSSGRTCVSVNYNDEQVELDVAAVLATFLAAQDSRICEVVGGKPKIAFVCPPDAPSDVARTIREAATIAGIAPERVHVVSKVACMRATYGRKLLGLRPVEISNLREKRVLMVEMGSCHSTAVLLSVSGAEEPVPSVLSYTHDSQLGALHFDLELFKHFGQLCVTKYKGDPVVAGSKRGHRLISGCERLRKLLSQLGESSVTVENMTDSGDIQMALKRDEMSQLCHSLLERFQKLLLDTLSKAGVSSGDVFAVEVLGGGMRMQVVQAIISSIFGAEMPLGAKFDDASVGLGASIVVNNAVVAAGGQEGVSSGVLGEEGEGGVKEDASNSSAFPALSEAELTALRAQELVMQKQDADIARVQAVRNEMEAFLLDMRGAPRRKFGNTIDSGKLNTLLDDVESWLWDNQEASLADLEAKSGKLHTDVKALCASFFEAVEKERVELEKSLEADAAAAAKERAEGGEDDDHDNRKLRFPDRMRLAVKNKDEGTELFKGAVSQQQFRTAAARYTKSLSHCMKFFDLSPEQTKEVNAMKVTLYLNLASCYLKLENAESAYNNCNHAIELDPKNAKGYFRRSMAHEAKRDWEKALDDIKLAQQHMEAPDKALDVAAKRVKAEILKEKEKAKGVWGKAFAGAAK